MTTQANHRLLYHKPIIKYPIVVFFCFAVFYKILIFPEVYNASKVIGWGLSVALFVWLAFFTDKAAWGWKHWLAIVYMPVVIQISFAQGFPAALHFFSEKSDFKEVVTVKGKISSTSCGLGFVHKEYGAGLFTEVCGLDKDFHRLLMVGDHVLLIGARTRWGFKYERYLLITTP